MPGELGVAEAGGSGIGADIGWQSREGKHMQLIKRKQKYRIISSLL